MSLYPSIGLYSRLEYQENPDTFLHLVRDFPIPHCYISPCALLKAKSLLLKGRYQLETDSATTVTSGKLSSNITRDERKSG